MVIEAGARAARILGPAEWSDLELPKLEHNSKPPLAPARSLASTCLPPATGGIPYSLNAILTEPIEPWYTYLRRCRLPNFKTRALQLNDAHAGCTFPEGLGRAQHRILVLTLSWLLCEMFSPESAVHRADADWAAGKNHNKEGLHVKNFPSYLWTLVHRLQAIPPWSPESLAEFLGENFERFKWLSVNPHLLERRPMRTEERRKLLDQNFGQSDRVESLMAEVESSPTAKAHPAPNKDADPNPYIHLPRVQAAAPADSEIVTPLATSALNRNISDMMGEHSQTPREANSARRASCTDATTEMEMDHQIMPRLRMLEDSTQHSMLILEKTRVTSSSGPSSPPSKEMSISPGDPKQDWLSNNLQNRSPRLNKLKLGKDENSIFGANAKRPTTVALLSPTDDEEFQPYRYPPDVRKFPGWSSTSDQSTQTKFQLIGPAHVHPAVMVSGCEGYGVYEVHQTSKGSRVQTTRKVLYLHAWVQTDLPGLPRNDLKPEAGTRHARRAAGGGKDHASPVALALAELNMCTSNESRAPTRKIPLARQRHDFYRQPRDPVGVILNRKRYFEKMAAKQSNPNSAQEPEENGSRAVMPSSTLATLHEHDTAPSPTRSTPPRSCGFLASKSRLLLAHGRLSPLPFQGLDSEERAIGLMENNPLLVYSLKQALPAAHDVQGWESNPISR